ncbi:Hypothetical predicted protein [Marmota monax]|uniref:MKRN2 opposite strand protein-like C-terminal domain-containing protein n=1 Tax=Marmota monax TaxID=9995 RepID=A0A5E4B2A4_MARMO|nr:Hypothetical predicted protein [Marmota monax]
MLYCEMHFPPDGQITPHTERTEVYIWTVGRGGNDRRGEVQKWRLNRGLERPSRSPHDSHSLTLCKRLQLQSSNLRREGGFQSPSFPRPENPLTSYPCVAPAPVASFTQHRIPPHTQPNCKLHELPWPGRPTGTRLPTRTAAPQPRTLRTRLGLQRPPRPRKPQSEQLRNFPRVPASVSLASRPGSSGSQGFARAARSGVALSDVAHSPTSDLLGAHGGWAEGPSSRRCLPLPPRPRLGTSCAAASRRRAPPPHVLHLCSAGRKPSRRHNWFRNGCEARRSPTPRGARWPLFQASRADPEGVLDLPVASRTGILNTPPHKNLHMRQVQRHMPGIPSTQEAETEGLKWAPGNWRKHLLASLIHSLMGIKKNAPSCCDQLRGHFSGVVYNYNQRGVRRDQAGWEQSLSVPLVQPNMFGLRDQWNRYLEDFSAMGAWLPHRYDEDHHNCYSYTLSFINCILTTEGKEQLDKNEFTEKYVIPRTRLASKYITLYRAIEKHGFYAVDHPDQGTSPPSEVVCAEGYV